MGGEGVGGDVVRLFGFGRRTTHRIRQKKKKDESKKAFLPKQDCLKWAQPSAARFGALKELVKNVNLVFAKLGRLKVFSKF